MATDIGKMMLTYVISFAEYDDKWVHAIFYDEKSVVDWMVWKINEQLHKRKDFDYWELDIKPVYHSLEDYQSDKDVDRSIQLTRMENRLQERAQRKAQHKRKRKDRD